MAAAPISPVNLPQGWRGPADSGDWSALQNLLQSESVSDLFWRARLFDLKTRVWTDLNTSEAANLVVFRDIARTTDRETYQVDVELRGHSSLWLEVVKFNQKAACVLLGDNYLSPRYTLRFDFADNRQRLTGLDVSPSSSTPSLVGEAAVLWTRFRSSNIDQEATREELVQMERQLFQKMDSPLAATIAALLLLRAWRPELLHDWLRNLAKFFPERPDGWVIWVEQLLRTRQDEGLDDAVAAFRELEHLSLPHTSEALGYAARQVEELLNFAFPKQVSRTEEPSPQYQSLLHIQARITRALAFFRPGGFGAVFIGPQEAITPNLILPA